MKARNDEWALAEWEVIHCPRPGCEAEDARRLAPPPPLAPARLGGALARTEAARRLWARCRPIDGTGAEAYLRAWGIRAPDRRALRFHPALYYRGAGDRDLFRRLPALVARVTSAAGAFVGVERIYLDLALAATARGAHARKRLGAVRGAAVDLGAASSPALIVTVGVEAALAALDARPAHRAAATLSLLGLGAYAPPEGPTRVLLAPGFPPALRAAAGRLAVRCRARGLAVAVLAPEHGDLDTALRTHGADVLGARIDAALAKAR